MDSVAVDWDGFAVNSVTPELVTNELIIYPDRIVVEDSRDDAQDNKQEPGESDGDFHDGLLDRLAEFLAEDGVVDIESAAVELVRSFQVPDAEQRNDPIAERETQHFMD